LAAFGSVAYLRSELKIDEGRVLEEIFAGLHEAEP
jgi:hypothetical protein